MASQPRRGRPAGLLLNPVAARHFLGRRPQTFIRDETGISTAQLSGMFNGAKGATRETADKLAACLECPVEILFPELVEFTTTVRHFTAPKVEDVAA